MKKNTKKLNKYLSLSLGVGMILGSLIQPISVVAEQISDEDVLPQETNSKVGEKEEEKLNTETEEKEVETKSLNDDDFFNWYNDLSKEEKKNFINSLKEKYGEIDDEFPKYYSIHDMING